MSDQQEQSEDRPTVEGTDPELALGREQPAPSEDEADAEEDDDDAEVADLP